MTPNPSLRQRHGRSDGAKFSAYRMRENRLLGDYLTEVMERALKMAESNACMKRIVAAPTAGSCGVIPAVLLSYASCRQVTEEKLVEALYVAAGIGEVIAASASIAGAEGGCQAEIGSASAMAAGALSYLEGGDCEEICHACALAMKSLLGLTCDPVAGLVEVPCIKRNASGAVNAVVASRKWPCRASEAPFPRMKSSTPCAGSAIYSPPASGKRDRTALPPPPPDCTSPSKWPSNKIFPAAVIQSYSCRGFCFILMYVLSLPVRHRPRRSQAPAIHWRVPHRAPQRPDG